MVSESLVVAAECDFVVELVRCGVDYVSVIVLVGGFFAYDILFRYVYTEANGFTFVPYAVFLQIQASLCPSSLLGLSCQNIRLSF